jgi:hypothetical protein
MATMTPAIEQRLLTAEVALLGRHQLRICYITICRVRTGGACQNSW